MTHGYKIDPRLYDFELDKDLIGANPKEKRDESRLFVFDTKTGEIRLDLFKNVASYLPEGSLMIFNETKVVPARAQLRKKTGGAVEVLLLVNEWDKESDAIQAMVDRKVSVGDVLSLGDKSASFEAVAQDENIFTFKMLFSPSDLIPLLEKYGETPVPKYIKGGLLPEGDLRKRYQSVFAREPGSVAAPTASLHFTEAVMGSLREKGIETEKIVLNIGLGTFAPLTEENVKNGRLHVERYKIGEGTAKAVEEAKEKGRPVIAVGTTAVRALESFGRTGALAGETDIFIRPPFEFEVVDHLITNFHLPNSSLMMLVEAFLEHKKSPKHLIDLYRVAMKERFMFYSFGDSMLIL